jgi:predicted ATPase/class 3 adenylate cyclase
MRRELPSGTVTFLFTDVEGSTKLLHELGAEDYAERLAEHRRVVREACTAGGGVEVDTQGDAFFIAFASASGAVEAARTITKRLASGPITLRIGLHTGTPLLTDEGYVGEDVHFAARVAASAHGGQVVLSRATRALIDERYPLLELGEHRLKDIAQPVAIFQLGDGRFPPLKTISNTNLPRPAGSFIGRERELQDLLFRIERGARLVTLTGPGGSGKTRLALEAAATLVPDYKAGVFWVGLAALRDPALVSEQIAHTLGAKDGLADHIGERELLLLLDNLEQVIESAPELSNLLQRCPNLTLLVTSRELMRVQGEVEYPVPPLAEAEAVVLFCDRAQTEPSEEINELCRRLDNLPLAVELAAARTKALSPAQILARLSQRLDLLKGSRDADPRQATLRATIEWSYELLTAQEQQLCRRLSVFAGGCTLEAAEQVADADLDNLQSLVEKSLLRFSDERYRMLETIREFAAERLNLSGAADEMSQRHATHFLDLAETKGLREAFEAHFSDLEREHDNFRSALTTFRRTSDTAAELRLARALGRFWYRGGYLREGMTYLEEALNNSDGVTASIVCEAHAHACSIASALGAADRTDFHAQAQLELARRRGGIEENADALLSMGCAARDRRKFGEARQYFEAALRTAREAGYDYRVVNVQANLAELALWEGDFDRAAELASEAIDLTRAVGWSIGTVAQFLALAFARLSQARIADASAALRAAAEIPASRELPQLLAPWLLAAAETVAAKGDDRVAAKLLGAAATIRREAGAELDPFEAGLHSTVIRRLRDGLSENFERAWAEGAAIRSAEAVALALDFLD